MQRAVPTYRASSRVLANGLETGGGGGSTAAGRVSMGPESIAGSVGRQNKTAKNAPTSKMASPVSHRLRITGLARANRFRFIHVRWDLRLSVVANPPFQLDC